MPYFTDLIGPALTLLGGVLAALVPGMGSSRGVGRAGEAAAGVLTENPSLFGKLLILQALPGTQGIYGLLTWFMIMQSSGLLSGNIHQSWQTGLLYFLAAMPITIVGYQSAIYQGRASEASIAMVAKQPEESSKAIVMPAMVETYAILGLLASVLSVLSINPAA